MNLDVEQLNAQLYDVSVPDWPGEIDFYRSLIEPIAATHGAVLEVACGTGRVTLQLARPGVRITGVDLSAPMLDIARRKSAGFPNVRFIEDDMRTFDLGETFQLIILPGHSFQFMLTPEDQLACLANLKRHLAPGGTLVIHLDHQSVDWLGGLLTGQGGVFEADDERLHPASGRRYRPSRAWVFAPSTQTATATTIWEELDDKGTIINRWERAPVPLHCVFRFEMEHLLARAGLEVQAVYGDFFRYVLTDQSEDMIWVARPAAE
ncbi:MAG: class I SAM-dependent methyltransferase [Chloroflexi bacterium]|nr:class I SAM-dependent methyltransferase [Chloroflexota bacterium]